MKSYFNNEEYIYIKSFLRTNPSEALIRTEEYIKKYPNDYIAGVFYSKVLKVLGSFSEALYVLGNIEERYTSNKKLFNDFAKYNIIEEKVLYNKLRCLSYLEDFDKLIDSGRLEFFLHEQNMIIKESTYYENLSEIENNEEEIRNDSRCCYTEDDYFIDISRTYDYDDVLTLIHEFIHSTNSSKDMGVYRYILTEFFSIYFEMLSQNELLEKGINPSELDIFDRIKNTGRISQTINKYDTVFMAYNLFGNIKEDSCEDLKKYHIVLSTKEDFEEACIFLLKYFDYQKIEYNNKNEEFNLYNYRKHISRMFSSGYRYLYGTLFACHLLENGNKDKIVWLMIILMMKK